MTAVSPAMPSERRVRVPLRRSGVAPGQQQRTSPWHLAGPAPAGHRASCLADGSLQAGRCPGLGQLPRLLRLQPRQAGGPSAAGAQRRPLRPSSARLLGAPLTSGAELAGLRAGGPRTVTSRRRSWQAPDEHARKSGINILIYGPPGTGKDGLLQATSGRAPGLAALRPGEGTGAIELNRSHRLLSACS